MVELNEIKANKIRERKEVNDYLIKITKTKMRKNKSQSIKIK